MKKFRKLAVFGGTFSPVHNGHLCALRAFYETVKPDVLYMIPTGQPPHKTRYDSATDRQRLDMLSLAAKTLKPEYNVVVSDIEIRRGGQKLYRGYGGGAFAGGRIRFGLLRYGYVFDAGAVASF